VEVTSVGERKNQDVVLGECTCLSNSYCFGS